ncbi:MAG: hypothetical protein IJH81_09820 [Lachnospiraceae bacterium]|nr:hypothetical protein [Lachnospiraceae bacterium]
MNEFMIRFASAENALEHMQQVESAIRSQSEEISKIRREFRADFRGKARILQNLYNQMNRMSGLGDSAKVFEDSLESILGIYNAVEQELLGQVEDTGRSGAAPSAVSSGGENASEKDREQDYIHNAGKRDEKRSLIPGASIIGAGTIGQYLLGDNQDPEGDPAGTQGAGGGEGQNADQAADGAGTSQAAPAVTDLDDLTAVLFPIPVDPDRIFKKEDPWEDFLHFLPAWLVEMLPDFALEYLHELFDLFRNLTELFGDVRFLDAEDILICGIWGTFYTLLIWYFYQKAFPQDGDTIETKSEDIRPIDESAEDGDPSEEEQELEDGPGDEESTREEDSNSVEDKEQDGDTPEEQDSVEDQGQDEETSENKQDSVENQGQDEETSENKQDSAEDRGQDESTAEKEGGAAEENSGAGDPESSPLKTGDNTSDRGQQTNDSRDEAGKSTADPASENSADDSGAKDMPGKPASDPAGDRKAARPAADPAGSSTVEKPATDPSIKSTTVKPIENPAAKSEAAKAAADPKAASGTAKAAADPKAASGTAKTADTGAGKTSGSGKPSGGGGGKSSGGGGKSSGGGGGKSSGGGSAGTDGSYLPEDTAAEVSDPGASDTTGDYLTSLLGEDSRNSTGISDWAKSTMDNWGQKAAEKLAESGAGEAAEKAAQTAAGIGGSPIGRTARSIVCAAVINAGIDMAMQGAGAVGSVLGGKDDLFKELGDSELV